MAYEIKNSNYNIRVCGIYKNDELEFSLTSIDFYSFFDSLAKFFNESVTYIKPRLYATNYDKTTKDGYKFYFNFQRFRGDYEIKCSGYGIMSYSYGFYNMEELREIFNSTKEYVLSAKYDMIFSSSSDTIYHINQTPYTMYKAVYPNSSITIDLMAYLVRVGQWYYTSKTLMENIEYINFISEDLLNQIRESADFKRFKEIHDKFGYGNYFNTLNNYQNF